MTEEERRALFQMYRRKFLTIQKEKKAAAAEKPKRKSRYKDASEEAKARHLERCKRYRERKRAEDPEAYKAKQREVMKKAMKKYREKKKAEDPEGVKAMTRKQNALFKERRMAEDPEAYKKYVNEHSKAYRERMKAENPELYKQRQAEYRRR